jgi:hypothetical protein
LLDIMLQPLVTFQSKRLKNISGDSKRSAVIHSLIKISGLLT